MPVLPRVGDRFGRYQIDAQIGQGGMGVVFGATDTVFDRRVALKVVSALLGDSDEFRQRFDREAAVLARLDSPHVIQIFDYGIENDCPYLSTQYVGGGDLGDLLAARGAMPPALAARVCAQVADALHDAHLAGVVHRDVKPGNVLLRDADVSHLHAYLCDFGIARLATEGLTAPGSVAGTWSYLSPECGRGEFGSPASDIYALGCLFWATLVGEAPYAGTDVAIAVAHQRSQVRQLVGTDLFTTAANAILARSMAKEPTDRYPDADQMRADLLAVAAMPVESVVPGPAEAPAPPGVVPPPPPSSTFPRGSGRSRPSGSHGSGTGRTAAGVAASGPAPRRRRTGLVVGLAVAAVLLVGGGIAAVAQLGGGADPAAKDPPPGAASGGGPTRVDDGGPITGDLDGDDIGDLSVQYTHPLSKKKDATNLSEGITWHSDGTALVDETSETTDDDPTVAVLPFSGQLDGDETTDVANLSYAEDDTITISGTTSDGTELGGEFPYTENDRAMPVGDDVDGDGDDDLVLKVLSVDADSQRILWSELDGGTFADPQLFAEIPGRIVEEKIALGDYDGDQLLDAVVVKHGDGINRQRVDASVQAYWGTGSGLEAGPQGRIATIINVKPIAADIDGDEKDELLIGQVRYSTVKVKTLDVTRESLGRARPIGVTRVGETSTFARAFGVSDVNGDGRDDLALVASGAVDGEAVAQMFISDGESLVASSWATFKRDFDANGGGEFVEVLGEPTI